MQKSRYVMVDGLFGRRDLLSKLLLCAMICFMFQGSRTLVLPNTVTLSSWVGPEMTSSHDSR